MFLVALLLTCSSLTAVHASHVRFGSLSWRLNRDEDGSIVPRSIVFTYKVAMAFNANVHNVSNVIGATFAPDAKEGGVLHFGDGQQQNVVLTVTSVEDRATCADSNWAFMEAAITHKYAAADSSSTAHVAYVDGCCRLMTENADPTEGTWHFRFQTRVNAGAWVTNTPTQNEGSPTAQLFPVVFVGGGGAAPTSIDVASADPDGGAAAGELVHTFTPACDAGYSGVVVGAGGAVDDAPAAGALAAACGAAGAHGVAPLAGGGGASPPMALAGASGTITWTPPAQYQHGWAKYAVSVRIADAHGAYSTVDFLVVGGNQGGAQVTVDVPSFAAGYATGTLGACGVAFDVTASSPQARFLAPVGMPPGATFDAGTGRFAWGAIPRAAAGEVREVCFEAADAGGGCAAAGVPSCVTLRAHHPFLALAVTAPDADTRWAACDEPAEATWANYWDNNARANPEAAEGAVDLSLCSAAAASDPLAPGAKCVTLASAVDASKRVGKFTSAHVVGAAGAGWLAALEDGAGDPPASYVVVFAASDRPTCTAPVVTAPFAITGGADRCTAAPTTTGAPTVAPTTGTPTTAAPTTGTPTPPATPPPTNPPATPPPTPPPTDPPATPPPTNPPATPPPTPQPTDSGKAGAPTTTPDASGKDGSLIGRTTPKPTVLDPDADHEKDFEYFWLVIALVLLAAVCCLAYICFDRRKRKEAEEDASIRGWEPEGETFRMGGVNPMIVRQAAMSGDYESKRDSSDRSNNSDLEKAIPVGDVVKGGSGRRPAPKRPQPHASGSGRSEDDPRLREMQAENARLKRLQQQREEQDRMNAVAVGIHQKGKRRNKVRRNEGRSEFRQRLVSTGSSSIYSVSPARQTRLNRQKTSYSRRVKTALWIETGASSSGDDSVGGDSGTPRMKKCNLVSPFERGSRKGGKKMKTRNSAGLVRRPTKPAGQKGPAPMPNPSLVTGHTPTAQPPSPPTDSGARSGGSGIRARSTSEERADEINREIARTASLRAQLQDQITQQAAVLTSYTSSMEEKAKDATREETSLDLA